MNFIKIICNSFEERDFIHKQGCIVNERKCKGRYECWKCPKDLIEKRLNDMGETGVEVRVSK